MSNINLKHLVEARNKCNFSQKYVALTIGVAPSTVSQWETGGKNPSRENIKKLADLYQVTVDYLIGRTEEESTARDELNFDEYKLIEDYRKLNKQGQLYIRQQMFMAITIYKNSADISDLEARRITEREA